MKRSKNPQKCKRIKMANKKRTTASKSGVTKTSQNDSKSEVHQNGSTELSMCQAEREKVADTVSNLVLISEIQNDSKLSAQNTRQSERIRNILSKSKATEQKCNDLTVISVCPVERKGSHDKVYTSILISELQNNSKQSTRRTRSTRRSKVNWNSVSESRPIEQNQNDSTVLSICQMDSQESRDAVSESNLNKKLHSDSKAHHTNVLKKEGTVCEFVVKLQKEYISLMQHHAKDCSLCSKILQTQENQFSVIQSRMCGRDLEIKSLQSNFKGDMVNIATLANPYLPSQELMTETSLKVHAKYEPTPVHERYEPSIVENEPSIVENELSIVENEPSIVENEPIPVYAKYEQSPVGDEPSSSIVYAERESTSVHANYKPTPVHAKYEPTPPVYAKYKPIPPVYAKYEPTPPVHAKYEPTPVHERYEPSIVENEPSIVENELSIVENEPIPVYAKYEQSPVGDEPSSSIVYAERESTSVHANYKPTPVHAKYEPTPPVYAKYKPTPPVHVKYEPAPPVHAKYEPAPPVYAKYEPTPPVYAKYEPTPPVHVKYEPAPPVHAKYEPAPPVYAKYKPTPPVHAKYDPTRVHAKYEPVPPAHAKYEPAPVRAKHDLMAMYQQTNTKHTQIPTPRRFPKYYDLTQHTAAEKLNVTKPQGVDVNPSGVTGDDVQIVGITQPKYIIPVRHQKNDGARNQGNMKDISKANQYETKAIGLNKQDSRNSLIDHYIDVSVYMSKKKPMTTNFVSSQGVHSTECRLPAQSAHQSSDLQLNKSGCNAMLNADSRFNPKPHVYKPTPLRFLPNLGNMRTANNVKVSGPHPPGQIPLITDIADDLQLPGNENANFPSQTDAKCSQADIITSSNLPNLIPLQSQDIPIIVSDVEVSKRVCETVKSNLNPLRRSGRKRKVRQSEEQYESDLDTDGSKNTLDIDGEFSDSGSSWGLETHPRTNKTHSKSKKLSKKMKPFVGPKDPTEVDTLVKGNFKCWLCQTTCVFCLNTKHHIVKKHGEGLCSFELNQTQLIGKMHILLYCPRSCSYATYDIDGLKKHTVSCNMPLLSVKGIKYLDLNNYFIQHIYPELINTEPQALFETSKTRKNSYELPKQQITTRYI